MKQKIKISIPSVFTSEGCPLEQWHRNRQKQAAVIERRQFDGMDAYRSNMPGHRNPPPPPPNRLCNQGRFLDFNADLG